jgi:predicted transcriptional regulator
MTNALTIEAINSHVLFYLLRASKPVTKGELKSKLLGTRLSIEEVLQALFDSGNIAYTDGKIELSVEGKYYLEKMIEEEKKRIMPLLFDKDVKQAMLSFYYHRPHLVHMDDVPKVLTDYVGNLNYMIFELRNYFHTPFMSWHELNELGRAYYEHQKGKTSQANGNAHTFSINIETNTSDRSVFTDGEIKKMNDKLDRMNELLKKELDVLKNGQEVIYTDVLNELGELRQYYNLPKKNWRQMFSGKLGEMVAGGVVSETLSKKIVELINPAVDKLLE